MKKAAVAVAHRLLTVVYILIRDGEFTPREVAITSTSGTRRCVRLPKC